MERLIYVPCQTVSLEGSLHIPEQASGIVIFAHGSGSSRHSPRNNFVAQALQKNGLGTLLIDLLSAQEDSVYETRFNIPLISQRLFQVIQWVQQQAETEQSPIGLFGASTGAAAALSVAAEMQEKIKAVVSRGGRPDLALPVLGRVTAPTLLIVGGNDFGVIELNQKAYDALASTKELCIIPGATHLFEEAGTLESAAKAAASWFRKYLTAAPAHKPK